ncbi:MAG: type III pantothenate kinase [Gammaproteobacteria bacterium]|nr:type III pantothenate kinase [Gammaproteobacteria bacterium]
MLLIDIGNSRIKAAYAEEGRLVELPAVATTAAPPIEAWQEKIASTAPLRRILISNVAGPDIAGAFERLAFERWQVEPEFVHPRLEFAGMQTRYTDPAQLGADRWLAALAAYHACGAAVCVVDAGTALTVDVVDQEGVHCGGLIAPGADLMSGSLTRGTAQLASDGVEPARGFATNTPDAISLGCHLAVRGLLVEVASRLEQLASGTTFTWYLTGGGAGAVRAMLPMQHVYDPSLVLRGLAIFGETCR